MSAVGTCTIDLHSHTWWSYDGFASFLELHSWQHDRGIMLLAATDHDSLDGWHREGEAMSAAECPWVVPGVELSCAIDGIGIGILAIGIEVQNAGLCAFLANETLIDIAELQAWIALVRHDFKVDFENVIKNWASQIFPEFPERSKRYVPEWIRKLLLIEAGIASDTSDALRIHQQLASRLPSRTLPSAPDAIELVHAAGGLAFLEHPPTAMTEGTVQKLCAHGLDGIETYSGHLDERERQSWVRFCGEERILPVAGSDHHGRRGAWGRLGQPWPHPTEVAPALIGQLATNTSWGADHPRTCSFLSAATTERPNDVRGTDLS